ncbi:MAG: outer membrane lipoprotein-sorting protein [Magnetococcales bacterium]|nr:outer membrane lipoprotein-sorting protein [Magnetococcales bacterium]
MNIKIMMLATALIWAPLSVQADNVPRNLALPKGAPTAEEVAKQVYFVNHFYAVKNFSIEKGKSGSITVIASRTMGEEPMTNTVERYLNNDYADGETKAKDLAIFRSGKLNGTGMLIVDYVDDAKSQAYSIWLPALRKIRRFAQPAFDDAWGGTDFTFEDVTLRKPHHETHELLGKESFNDCLMAMELTPAQAQGPLATLHKPACNHKGREVYKVKSTTQFKNWWYEYRVSFVDTQTFADYRTDFFKDGKKIKTIDRDWAPLGLSDPRALKWRYWYGRNYVTNHETMASIPDDVVQWNTAKEEGLWSEQTLSKINR